MITFEIVLNKTYKGSCNLIVKKMKGHYIYVDNDLHIALIDNIAPCKWEEIHDIRFMVKGYYQVVYVNQRGKIEATDIEYKEVK